MRAFVLCGALVCAVAALAPKAMAQCAPGDMLIEQTDKGAWCGKRLYNPADFDAEAEAMIQSMVKFGASPADRYRLDNALHQLDPDPPFRRDSAAIARAWNAMRGRTADDRFREAAASGQGPGLYGSGTQSEQDCAVFALATAAGIPYGAAAARATELIGQGPWRPARDRVNPQDALERRGGGLMGGEVIILAEGYGRAVVTPPPQYATTLQQGYPVMLGVAATGGSHQIVLSKTFQMGAETWFEVIDSNQGPTERLYASASDLAAIAQENGVSYRPEPNRTAPATIPQR